MIHIKKKVLSHFTQMKYIYNNTVETHYLKTDVTYFSESIFWVGCCQQLLFNETAYCIMLIGAKIDVNE